MKWGVVLVAKELCVTLADISPVCSGSTSALVRMMSADLNRSPSSERLNTSNLATSQVS